MNIIQTILGCINQRQTPYTQPPGQAEREQLGRPTNNGTTPQQHHTDPINQNVRIEILQVPESSVTQQPSETGHSEIHVRLPWAREYWREENQNWAYRFFCSDETQSVAARNLGVCVNDTLVLSLLSGYCSSAAYACVLVPVGITPLSAHAYLDILRSASVGGALAGPLSWAAYALGCNEQDHNANVGALTAVVPGCVALSAYAFGANPVPATLASTCLPGIVLPFMGLGICVHHFCLINGGDAQT